MAQDRETIRSQLSAFLDGQLSPDQADRVAEAVEADAQLQAELAELEQVRRLLRDLPRESAPENLAGSIMERVERDRLLREAEQPAQVRPVRWLRPAAVAAILLLGVGVGLFAYRHLGLNARSWVDQTVQNQSAASTETPEPEVIARAEDHAPDTNGGPSLRRIWGDGGRGSGASPQPHQPSQLARDGDLAYEHDVDEATAAEPSPALASPLMGKDGYFACNNSLRVVDINVVDVTVGNLRVQQVLGANGVTNVDAAAQTHMAGLGDAESLEQLRQNRGWFVNDAREQQQEIVASVPPAQAEAVIEQLRQLDVVANPAEFARQSEFVEQNSLAYAEDSITEWRSVAETERDGDSMGVQYSRRTDTEGMAQAGGQGSAPVADRRREPQRSAAGNDQALQAGEVAQEQLGQAVPSRPAMTVPGGAATPPVCPVATSRPQDDAMAMGPSVDFGDESNESQRELSESLQASDGPTSTPATASSQAEDPWVGNAVLVIRLQSSTQSTSAGQSETQPRQELLRALEAIQSVPSASSQPQPAEPPQSQPTTEPAESQPAEAGDQ